MTIAELKELIADCPDDYAISYLTSIFPRMFPDSDEPLGFAGTMTVSRNDKTVYLEINS